MQKGQDYAGGEEPLIWERRVVIWRFCRSPWADFTICVFYRMVTWLIVAQCWIGEILRHWQQNCRKITKKEIDRVSRPLPECSAKNRKLSGFFIWIQVSKISNHQELQLLCHCRIRNCSENNVRRQSPSVSEEMVQTVCPLSLAKLPQLTKTGLRCHLSVCSTQLAAKTPQTLFGLQPITCMENHLIRDFRCRRLRNAWPVLVSPTPSDMVRMHI